MPHTVQKRQSSRLAVLQPATLTSQRIGSISGEIRDFSTNGVLFTLLKPAAAIRLQDQTIIIAFRSGSVNPVQYRVAGRVVRVFDRSIGIAIDNFPADVYRALVESANQPRQTKTADSPVYTQAQTLAALEQCHAQFKLFITQVVAHFYHSLDAKLVSSQADTSSSAERWFLHSAYPLLVARRNEIAQMYLDESYLSREVQDAEARAESLTLELVDMEEFDDWLAVSQLIHKLNLDYAAEIEKFGSRYATLIDTASSIKTNPFGVHHIFWVFHAALAENKFGNELNALFYKVFYEAVLAFVGDFYAALNEILAFVKPARPDDELPSGAITPSPITPQPPQSPVRDAPAPSPDMNRNTGAYGRSKAISIDDYLYANTPYSHSDGGAVPSVAMRQQQPASQSTALDYGLSQMLWRVNFLLNNADVAQGYQAVTDAVMDWTGVPQSAEAQSSAGIPAMYELPGHMNRKVYFRAPSVRPDAAAVPVGTHIARADYLPPILDVLNGIQRRRVEQGDDIDETPIKSQLMDVLAQFENATRFDPLIQTINFFDEALTTRLSGNAANSDIRGLLKKIELPMVKLVLLDEEFSQSSTDAARQTVNLIERFYAAADDMGKIIDQRLQRLLNLLVNQVVDQFEHKISVFDEVNRVLIHLLIPIEEARKNKITQIQLMCQQRQKPAFTVDEPGLDEPADIDLVVMTIVDLMCRGDWLAVMINGDPVAYQLICMESEDKLFVFANRSATTVREFPRHMLYRDLTEGQVRLLPEYDLPFMERSAYKGMLNVYEQVCRRATHDSVSGLFNHKGLMGHLETVFGYAAEQKRRIVLCMLLVDRFSLLYHNCDAEEAEVSFAPFISALAEQIKPTDVLARLGENTFVILMQDSDLTMAQTTMQSVLASIEEQRIRCQDKYFVIGANIGISSLTDAIGSPQELLSTAGAACVAAKAQGANNVEVYRPDNKQIEQEQNLFEWAGIIDQVINDGLLFLRCQKIQPIDVDGGYLPHYEILLGINGGTTIDPQGFVLAAEKWRRSADIDLWVLQQSIAWLTAQGDKLNAIAGVSINLSGHSLNNQKIGAYIKHALQTDPVLASKIIFEITETAVIQNLEAAQRFIVATRAYGCRFSLDDFGSGYNSFAYLRNLSMDYLKIDGIFVRDIVASATDFALVKSMHEVARALGLQTIAEYVENDAILAKLHELGIDYAQGYGVEASKPLKELVL